MEQDKLRKIIEAARLYYELDYNQQEIAQKLGVSRPTVSRFLQQAKEEGIVRIEIIDPSDSLEQLASTLEQKFNLKKVVLVAVPHDENALVAEYIGKAGAEYLHEVVKDEDIIGVTWGTTLYHLAQALKPKPVHGVQIVQLKGGISHAAINTHASEIVTLFGQAYGTTPHHLPLPAIVDHVVVKQAIEADRHIHKVLEMGKEANIAVFTVGGVGADSLLLRLGYFTEEDLRLIKASAAGDICSRFFDKTGKICSESLNNRTIGLGLDYLKEKEQAILVAGGAKKVEGIRGALMGGYANVLVTDSFTARTLVET
ncbi:sugar-binding transcriptional regulator [Aneurinibacillus sp. REN35]|uniref:sugar-binding transcriptional regulator n=1 Tax=Aneurinibacillus sp. REN35 TaxID=3237286 RepID=UPI003526D3AF